MRRDALVQHPVRLVLLLVATLVSVVLWLQNRPDESASGPEPRLGLGYYMLDARLTGTGPDGRILYRVRAASAEQALADGSVTLNDVSLEYAPGTELPWEVTAGQGQIPPDRNIIVLLGDVVAITRSPAQPLTRIRSEYLELDPETFVATTGAEVLLERDRDTLRARGMRVWLKEDRVQLDGQVRGHFVP